MTSGAEPLSRPGHQTVLLPWRQTILMTRPATSSGCAARSSKVSIETSSSNMTSGSPTSTSSSHKATYRVLRPSQPLVKRFLQLRSPSAALHGFSPDFHNRPQVFAQASTVFPCPVRLPRLQICVTVRALTKERAGADLPAQQICDKQGEDLPLDLRRKVHSSSA